MPQLRHGQARGNRRPAQVGYAEHCTNCDHGLDACRCGLSYALTRTNEDWQREFIRIAKPRHGRRPIVTYNLDGAELFHATEAEELMLELNSSIYDQRHQWGMQST